MSATGFNFGQLLDSSASSISNKGASLQEKMSELQSKENIGPEDMLPMQFQMGQYTATIEMTSAVTKGMTETLKSLAQRT